MSKWLFPTVQGFVSYRLPLSSVSWAAVFKDIEENKERLGIIDYSISQITLEQVTMSCIIQRVVFVSLFDTAYYK